MNGTTAKRAVTRTPKNPKPSAAGPSTMPAPTAVVSPAGTTTQITGHRGRDPVRGWLKENQGKAKPQGLSLQT